MSESPCRWCGAPLKYVHSAKGWVHTQPLADFRLSRREADDIRRDPPPAKAELGRQTYIHPAQPI